MVGCKNLPSVFPSFTGSSIPANSPDPNSVLPTNRRMPSQRGVTTTAPTWRPDDDDMRNWCRERAAVLFCR